MVDVGDYSKLGRKPAQSVATRRGPGGLKCRISGVMPWPKQTNAGQEQHAKKGPG